MSEFKTPVKMQRRQKGAETPFVIPASPFLKQLGYGTGANVYEFVRSPRTGQPRSPWAIKRIAAKNQRKNSEYSKRILKEENLLKTINHPNIVGYRASMRMSDGRLCLGMESCGKSLGDLIEERVEKEMPIYSPSNILKVALDIGNALDYLHTNAKLLHGDMKSFNILINGDFEICKLCDFGVSLHLNENGIVIDETRNEYIGTELWSAPEIIIGEKIISTKADIFSFGLVLWEMLALKPPHSDFPCKETMDESVICLDDTDDSSMLEDITCGTRPDIPDDIDAKLYTDVFALFHCLTEADPKQRPSAQHVVLCAEDMIEKRKRGIQYIELL